MDKKMVRFAKEEKDPIRVSMEVIVRIVSKLVDFTYLQDLQPTYIGVLIHLLSTMDIPVGIMGLQNWLFGDPRTLLFRVKLLLVWRVQWFLGENNQISEKSQTGSTERTPNTWVSNREFNSSIATYLGVRW